MLNQKPKPDEPFWKDDLNPYYRPSLIYSIKGFQPRWISKLILFNTIFIYLLIFGLLILFALSVPILWLFVVIFAIATAAAIYGRRFGIANQDKVVRIQQHAKELTRTDYIGSAIHTAGHPLLQANQPVVLALRDAELSIYSYDSPAAIDTIPVADIIDTSPVVFDDDYIPHVGVIDNTAQALQITIKRQNMEYTCSFRRMYKVRPIEWFHVIQAARVKEKTS